MKHLDGSQEGSAVLYWQGMYGIAGTSYGLCHACSGCDVVRQRQVLQDKQCNHQQLHVIVPTVEKQHG